MLQDHAWWLVDAPLLLSNRGVLTDHFSLFADETWPRTSLLYGLGEPWQVRAFTVGACALDIALVLGIRTRAAATLALIAAISISARNPLVYYGGDLILHTLLAWGLLLPLGDRFSVDAWLARRRGEARGPTQHVSLAVLGPTVELALVYFFNGFLKTGPTWSSGSAIHYTLWMDCLVRPSGVWLRTHAPTWLMTLFAWSTRIVEESSAALLLSPCKPGWSRLLALTPLFVLHLAILSTTAIANFALVMIGSYTLLITPSGWQWISRAARVLRLECLANAIDDAGSDDVQGEALAQAQDLTPSGAIVAGVGAGTSAPVSSGLSSEDASGEAGTWPARADAEHGAAPPRHGVLAELDWLRVGVWIRELAAAAFLFATLSSAYTSSPLAPESWRFAAPRWTFAINGPLHNRHVWGLFAPDAPTEEGLLVIEGQTRDGRRIDPLTGKPPREVIRQGEEANSNTRFYQWTRYVRLGEWRRYRADITRFVWVSHELPGRDPRDAIVRFRAINLHRASPPLGSRTVGPTRRQLLWEEERPG